MKKILLYFLLPLLVACADDRLDMPGSETLPTAPDGKTNIGLNFSAGAFHKPTVKGVISDTDFDSPYILSFRKTGSGAESDAVLIDVVKTVARDGKYYATLTTGSDAHVLVAIANADKLIEHVVSNNALVSKTYDEVMPYFTFGDPTSAGGFGVLPLQETVGTVPFAAEKIPMWAKIEVAKIDKQVAITQTFNLQRVVSKVYVDANQANQNSGFVLTGFSVIDVPSLAYIDNDAAENVSQPQTPVDYGTKTGTDRLTGLILTKIKGNTTKSASDDRPVYVYPFRSNDSRDGAFYAIISGHFGDNTTRYFKLKIGGETNPASLKKQNVSYLINVISLKSLGYAVLSDALRLEPNSGNVVKVTIIDDSKEYVANGQHYLGVTNSEFQLYADGAQNDVVVITVTTNAFDKAGASVYTNIELFAGDGVTLVPGQSVSSNTTDIKVNFVDRQKATGVVRVSIGELTKDILIKKDWALVGNYRNGSNGFLIADDVIKAEVANNTSRVGLSTTMTSSERSQVLVPAAPASLYAFVQNMPDLDVLEINAFTASGKSILVRNVTNIPEFAGNNIYWDAAKNRPAFENYLTAQANGTQNIQGVMFFEFGSLISGQGSTLTPEAGHLKAPNNDPVWSHYTWITRHTIPEVTYSEYMAQGKIPMDPNHNKGDMCEFMTRRGFTPQNKKGTKWKMASADEVARLPRRGGKLIGAANADGVVAKDLADRNGLSRIETYVNVADLFCFTPVVAMAEGRAFGSFRALSFMASRPNTTQYNQLYLSLSGQIITDSSNPSNFVGNIIRCVRDDSDAPVVPLHKVSYDVNEADGVSVTIPSGSKLLSEFVDAGSSVVLSDVVLQSSIGKIHTGWLINNTYYPLGATIPNVRADLTAKAVWGFIAGSNIYWDGTKLTFDDVPVGQRSLNEHKQGVLFKFGSLVAVGPSSHNDAWNPFPPNFPLNSKVLDPTVASPSWSNTDYDLIPQISVPAGVNTGKAPYLIGMHNESAKVGDICKFLTDKGWAPGADKGVKWRMPTLPEMKQQIYTYEGTDWTPLVLDTPGMMYEGTYELESGVYLPSSNVFYPASGSRKFGTMNNTRYYGDYWLSSIEAKSARAFYFKKDKQLFNLTAPLNAAFPVRCIRDISIH